MTPPPMTERQLQNAVIDLAMALGYRHYHTFNSRRSNPGYPDLTLVRGRRLVFAELKTEKGRARAAQTEWLDLLARTTAEAYLWRPSHWLSGEIERCLRAPTPETGPQVPRVDSTRASTRQTSDGESGL